MIKRYLKVLLAGLTLLLIGAQPGLAHYCVDSRTPDPVCVYDSGCAAYPDWAEPPGQWWTYTYCVHSDGTEHIIDRWESGGCCDPY